MGKRSDFPRVDRDFYPTPEAAVLPLLPHLPYGVMFAEPCAGDGALIRALEKHGMSCVEALDIEPRTDIAYRADALDWRPFDSVDCIITNPPWRRDVLHPMIECFAHQRPTWLLFDADWMHTRQAAPYLPLLRKIVSVGRVKWIPDSKMTGKDNCVWHLFDAASDSQAVFIGRAA
jgi:hypothetical protein